MGVVDGRSKYVLRSLVDEDTFCLDVIRMGVMVFYFPHFCVP